MQPAAGERHVVRAPCDAQVTKILVASGDRVAIGQEIARLASDKLVLELAELESALAQGEVKQRSQRTKKQLGDWQVEEHRQESLAERIAECRQKLASLTLRAPLAGRVIARRIADLPGSYLAEGAEVCTAVSDEQEKADAGQQARLTVLACDLVVDGAEASGAIGTLPSEYRSDDELLPELEPESPARPLAL